jgi:hypothetical protein
MKRNSIAPAAAIVAWALSSAAGAQVAISVEYYHAGLDHFFVSSLAADIDALDSGRFGGWARTGQTFGAAAHAGAGLAPVCRFYIPPPKGDSHFFSASVEECQTVLRKSETDPDYAGFVYESPSAWFTALPDTRTGACPDGTVPAWRLWNRRADSNHRYTANPAVREQMLARGYVSEGYGPQAVSLCAPALPPAGASIAVSGATPFAPGCDGAAGLGTLYAGAEVEPMIAVSPTDADHVVAVWQQDRWSNGGARGLVTAASQDGGRTWARAAPAFSRCAGGNGANGGDYARATDPWVSFATDGTAWQIALAFSGTSPEASSTNAILVSRSVDGGRSWSDPHTLIHDSGRFFNDKESITADRFDARFVYAVWDRLDGAGGGPTYFARTTDGGATWERPRAIYDPGNTGQTINNQLVVLGDGTLLVLFTRLPTSSSSVYHPEMQVIRSNDRGATWSPPILVAPVQARGTFDADSGLAVRDAENLGSIAAGPAGEVAVVWQDARFSGGTHDGIAFSRSTDSGVTWSPPVRINGAPAARAFVPALHIRADGVIGVTYYDLRNDLPDPDTLAADLWLTRSLDGVNWLETHVDGPFDLYFAPLARGLFLGDYMGLASVGTSFLPLYVRTHPSSGDNRTDVIAHLTATLARARSKARDETHGADGTPVVAHAAAPLADSPALRAMRAASVARTLERRRR